MKFIDIARGGLPPKNDELQGIQNSVLELSKIFVDILGPTVSSPKIISGCLITIAPPLLSISSGAMYFDGKLYTGTGGTISATVNQAKIVLFIDTLSSRLYKDGNTKPYYKQYKFKLVKNDYVLQPGEAWYDLNLVTRFVSTLPTTIEDELKKISDNSTNLTNLTNDINLGEGDFVPAANINQKQFGVAKPGDFSSKYSFRIFKPKSGALWGFCTYRIPITLLSAVQDLNAANPPGLGPLKIQIGETFRNFLLPFGGNPYQAPHTVAITAEDGRLASAVVGTTALGWVSLEGSDTLLNFQIPTAGGFGSITPNSDITFFLTGQFYFIYS